MDTFYHTDFSPSVMDWDASFSATGSTVVRTTDPKHVYEGEAGLLFTTASGTAYQRASIGKWFPFEKRRLVCDVWFQLPSSTIDVAFEFAPQALDGADVHLPSLVWTIAAQYNMEQWRVWDVNGAWADFPGGAMPLFRGAYSWHHLIWVADFAARQYVSMEIDGTVIDLSGIPYEVKADTRKPHLNMAFLVWNQTTTSVKGALGKVTLGWQ